MNAKEMMVFQAETEETKCILNVELGQEGSFAESANAALHDGEPQIVTFRLFDSVVDATEGIVSWP
jgi:hypothetical protein